MDTGFGMPVSLTLRLSPEPRTESLPKPEDSLERLLEMRVLVEASSRSDSDSFKIIRSALNSIIWTKPYAVGFRFMYVCMYVCMYIYIYVCVCVFTCTLTCIVHPCMHACTHTVTYVGCSFGSLKSIYD